MQARCERGQASVEYAGLVALLAVALSALLAAAPGPARALPATLSRAMCAAVDRACAAAEPEPPTEQELVDRWAAAELGDFLTYRSSEGRDPRLDYSTDLCSAPVVGSEGRTFDFSDPCIRHDFGYRNYSDLGLFSERRRAVDGRFLADMKEHCEARLPWELARCEAWARAFHAGVRGFGWAAGG